MLSICQRSYYAAGLRENEMKYEENIEAPSWWR